MDRQGESSMESLVSNSTEDPPYKFDDYAQRVIVATLILMISILGIIGNSHVILAVLLSKKLRTVTNAFVVNLCVADLLTCLVIPWHSVALLSRNQLPVLGVICGGVAVVIFATVGCSIYTLASIGLNRLLLIKRPRTTYPKVFTPKKTTVLLVLTWLIPLVFILSPLLLGLGSVGYNSQLHFCGPDRWHKHHRIFDVIIAVALYPVPFTTITVCYILIWMHLRGHVRRMVSIPMETGDYTDVDGSVAPRSPAAIRSHQPVNPPQISRRQQEITKNMFYIVCAFMLCLTPYTICLFLTDSDALKPYAAALVLFNSCINPLIYATKHRDFKAVFHCIVRRQWDNIPEPSDCLKAVRRGICGRGSRSA
ncbi:alpha-1D adrenergic receptor-like [Patiria miniata]|uniref:G-protein coupled receptors family 1 profile domain-containing protein n=1 Tax=Patiria miniata TaxID=46514 RepID=A0A913Z070_PATMI|nr:alpha-1D adrenergic receptor-like [Patiria miniata]